MLDTNRTELQQVIKELQELKVKVEKGKKVSTEMVEISNKVTSILNAEQHLYASAYGKEFGGTVVIDEKLNALFSANAYLHTKFKRVDDVNA